MFLGKTKTLENEIDKFLGKIQDINQMSYDAITEYLKEDTVHFENHVERVRTLEKEIDDLRISIEHSLYGGMLIPESRGDILGILESLDDVADSAKEVTVSLDIEKPGFPDFLKQGFLKMALMSRDSVDELIQAVHLFFTNSDLTGRFIKKVNYYEHEIDLMEEDLKRQVFSSSELDWLSHKIHLRYFIEKLAEISDGAESVSQRLILSTMKRSI